MEESMNWEQLVSLIGELKQGKELAKKLFDHLASPSSSSSSSSSSSPSHEDNEALIEKILSIYEKALTMLNSKNVGETKANNVIGNNNMLMDITNCSSFANGSSKSKVLDQEIINHKDVSKKRKSCMPRWTNQVKVCPGTIDGSVDDGYSWRKYGQKDILGAKFPRGYYRCTHRNTQGCLATKQVQKTNEDPTLLEITYKGRHTCIQSKNKKETTTTLISSNPKKLSLEENKNQSHPKNQLPEEAEEEEEEEKTEQQQPSQDTTVFTFGFNEVKIEDSDTKKDIFPSFCYNVFCDAMIENNFMDQCFSETNIFNQLGNNGQLGLSVQTSDSDISENMISTPTTSAAKSSIFDLDFPFDAVDFNTEFPVDSYTIFS